ncbi:TonB family protein [Perlucidibaca aquatica]|uniref:TonB family protein n=1 Tax=Perlucidibaca aquatica TaxID=1852776 RepID=UPI00083B2C5A|nr:TonB family protein [Perlucidibaca aquatica]
MKLSLPNILLSLLLHGVVLALFWVYAKPASLPEPPKVMQAILMSAPAAMATEAPMTSTPIEPVATTPVESPAPKPLPKPEPKPEPKKVPLPTPKPTAKPTPKTEPKVEPKPTVPAKPKPIIEPVDEELEAVEQETKRLAEAQATARKQREAEARQQALADALKAEADAIAADAAKERARLLSAQIGQFQLAINRKVKSNWRRPAAVSGKLMTELRITLLPGGEVASVVVVKSSGNDAFDESAKDAVNRANPLPVPSDAVLFREQFKVLLLKFKPEE